MKYQEELQKIKGRVLQQKKSADEGVRARILVAMGTCGIASGAQETMTAIVNTIKDRNLSDVIVTQTGCVGLCEFEPVVQIQVGNNTPVIYGEIDSERVPTLIKKHILQGEAVTEWLVK